MKLREILRTRRQRKARKRYEQEKARREFANSPDAMKRAEKFGKDVGGGGSGLGV
jgi:hypothetical protein